MTALSLIRLYSLGLGITLISCITPAAMALSVKADPRPGGIVKIALQHGDLQKPTATFNQRKVLIVKDRNWWQAVIGIGLHIQPGVHALSVNGGERMVRFNVISRTFPKQFLTIKNKRKVNPMPADQLRIERESARIKKARNTWTQSRTEHAFVLPVQGRKSSSFGVRRILNGQPRNPHSGMDIAAATGTPVIAPATATVLDTGHFFYTGKTVLLDHGQGLISLYAHLAGIDVNIGDQLQQGQSLGTIGATGRVTGPHLHWSVALNGHWIDPQLLLP